MNLKQEIRIKDACIKDDIMVLERILTFSKSIVQKATKPGDVAVDATIGNGHDTLFLADLVGEAGFVYGFDIQQAAINETTKRLIEHSIHHVKLICDGHEHFAKHIDVIHHHNISSAMFNLGYLPGSDKSITTQGRTTIQAIESIFHHLKINGIIVLAVYSGHMEGSIEKDQLLECLQHVDQTIAHVLIYRFINQTQDAPFVIAIEKRSHQHLFDNIKKVNK